MKLPHTLSKLIQLYRTDLVTPYRKFFELTPADSPKSLDIAYRLRYDVYCSELEWEEPRHHPDGKEWDLYDSYSRHILLKHKRSGLYAGTVRLVKTSQEHPENEIPLLQHYEGEFFNGPYHPSMMVKGTYGEISRLALRAEFRRRPGEQESAGGHGKEHFEWRQDERRQFPHIALGLYLAAAATGIEEGLDGVYAMMEPRLARHLRYAGIRFEQIGGAVDFRGTRAPYYINKTSLRKHMVRPLKHLLRAIEDDLSKGSPNGK